MRTSGIVIILLMTSQCLAYNGQQSEVFAGPYSSALENQREFAADAGISGFIGPEGRGICPAGANDENPSGNDPSTVVNPVFKGWADGYTNYIPAPAAVEGFIGHEDYAPFAGVPAAWRKPAAALGPVTGDNFDVCVLGDLYQHQLAVLDPADPNYAVNQALPYDNPYKIQPGQITLTFSTPIQDGPGPDFAVFENGFISAGGAGVSGQIFAELSFVEVSSDGVMFVRFPCVSLTEPTNPNVGGVGAYGTIDPSAVYNLAGKHVNAYEQCWGTPFNLKDILNDPCVLSGTVDVNDIHYVRIVDIPGNGFFQDTAQNMINPNTIETSTGTGGEYYTTNHGIHDAWVTWGSGGHDLEAIGVIEQIYGDANSDGRVDLDDFYRLAGGWQRYGNWPQGDFNENGFVDLDDLFLLTQHWLNKTSK